MFGGDDPQQWRTALSVLYASDRPSLELGGLAVGRPSGAWRRSRSDGGMLRTIAKLGHSNVAASTNGGLDAGGSGRSRLVGDGQSNEELESIVGLHLLSETTTTPTTIGTTTKPTAKATTTKGTTAI